MEDGIQSTSAFDTDELNKMMSEAHDIANHGKDQTKLLSNFQNKVKELLYYRQESINLKAQLQISDESRKMMEAEFAFQKSQLESEIERKNQTEKELREALVKKEKEFLSQTKHYDVNALVTVQEKYKKWKNAAEELAQQNEELKQQNQAISSELQNEKSKINQFKQLNSNLQNQLNDRPTVEQVDDLNKQIQHLQKKIERRNQAISDLKSENESLKQLNNYSDEYNPNSQLPDSNNEIERLKMKLDRTMKQLDKLKKTEQNNLFLKEIVEHYDAERQVLNDIMETEDTDPSQEWTNLREKARQGIAAIAKLDETASLLTSAEKRMAEQNHTIEEIKKLHKQIAENESKLASFNELSQKLSKVLNEYNAYKIETEKIHNYAEQQKIRCLYAKTISENQQKLIESISNLYYAITGKKEVFLRPLALAVIFFTRWLRLFRSPPSSDHLYDSTSLVSFTSIPSHSIDIKLDTIRDVFVSLSNELLTTKSALQKAYSKANKYKQRLYEISGSFEANNVEIQNLQKMCQVYKDTIAGLNEKMTRYVSPKKFEKLLSHFTEMELEIDKLNKENSNLKSTNDQKNETIKKFNKEISSFDLTHQNVLKEKGEIEEELEKSKSEIAILKAKLNDRTKELLALERLVHIKQPDLLPNQKAHDSDSFETENSVQKINPMFLIEPDSPEE